MSEAPLKATLKAGTDYDAPWLSIEANTPQELADRLNAIIEPVIPALIEAANALKAANNLAPLLQNGAEAAQQPAQAPQGGGGWGSQSQQQSAPQQAPQQQGGAASHPEGKQCQVCSSVLQYKVVTRRSDNKQFKFWACPNQRNRDDGHTSEFA